MQSMWQCKSIVWYRACLRLVKIDEIGSALLFYVLHLWRWNINQVQYRCFSQWNTVQQLHTSSIICVHKLKKKQSSFTINTSLKIFFLNYQSPVQVNWAWKNFRKFSMFNSSKTWVKKFQKYFQSFECLVVKCQKIFKNILSPNWKWIPNMSKKILSSDPKINGYKPKDSK